MESIDEYYSSRTRLIVSCVLLITWEFFGKGTKPDIDFDYLNIAIASEAIPFLLALFAFYNTYSLAFHWKLIEDSKKAKLSITDYYIVLGFSFFSLLINFFYQISTSNSSKFLSATTEGTLAVTFFFGTSVFSYLSRKYDGIQGKLLNPVWKIYMTNSFLILSSILLIYEIYRYRLSNKLNIYETIYFYSFFLVSTYLFSWAAMPKQTHKIEP